MEKEFLKTKSDIEAWLGKHKVHNYTLVEDTTYGYTVKVNGNVKLYSRNLSFIPVKFSSIKGHLDVRNNRLTSLEFCPKQIGKDFSCYGNELTSLKFCPETIISGFFSCGENQLNSLEFCPRFVAAEFYCDNNLLTSLEYFPEHVGGECNFSGNKDLGSLQNIENFTVLHEEHLRIVNVKKEKELLTSLIEVNSLATTNNSNNFKI